MKKLCVILLLLMTSTAFAQQKFALVIGNGAYVHTTRLNNPVNDANDMTTTLQGLGFTVDKVLNGTQDQMVNSIIRLKNRLSASRNTYGFFFYAGHGIQANGENYLIPVDANIPTENFLRNRTVSVQEMLDELNDAGNELNVVILDACRDNPFSWRRSSTRGLTIVGQQPADSIIIYSTSAGSTAADGTGRNGLFTTHLLNNLRISGLDVNEVFRRTGADVARVSNNQQRPAVYNQFYGIAYLGQRPTTPVQPIPIPTAPLQSNQQNQVAPSTIITETIFVNQNLGHLTYNLSNNIYELEQLIYVRTGRNISLENVNWTLNTINLSQNVKDLMNRYNVNYSLTAYSRHITVNKRVNNQWYYFGYDF